LLSWPGRPAIAEVFDLLWAQGTAGVNGLNSALLLGEGRLNGRGWGLVDEWARLLGRAWDRPVDLGRDRLRANRLQRVSAHWFRLWHRPRRYGRRSRRRYDGCPVAGWNRRRGGWMDGGRRSDDLRLALLRKAGAVYR
jgi:hypothetical protein